MLLVRSKLTTDFHIGWQSGAELTNQLRDADYGSKNDWCLVSRMSYATKKQRKFKSLLMYCSVGLPKITADKLARVHSQSCTSHGPQVVQRKQKTLVAYSSAGMERGRKYERTHGFMTIDRELAGTLSPGATLSLSSAPSPKSLI